MSEHLPDVDQLIGQCRDIGEGRTRILKQSDFAEIARLLSENAKLNADLAFIRRRTGFWGEVPQEPPFPYQQNPIGSASIPTPPPRCEHGVVIDPTGGYVCVKCFRAPQTTEGGPT